MESENILQEIKNIIARNLPDKTWRNKIGSQIRSRYTQIAEDSKLVGWNYTTNEGNIRITTMMLNNTPPYKTGVKTKVFKLNDKNVLRKVDFWSKKVS